MNFGLHKIIDSSSAIPPRVVLGLPRNWRIVPTTPSRPYVAFINTLSGLRVLTSIDTMEDGSKYTHVSCSYSDRLPSWEDLKSAKDVFIGEDREAFQVLPKQEDYVNVHQYCLHLWAEE